MAEVHVTKDLANKTLTIEYIVDAPTEKVWRAYSEKELFEAWWGPEGWETTAKEFNFTPGGRIHYGMKCVDEKQGEWFGQESWGMMELENIDDQKSFAYKDHFSDADGTLNAELPSLTITNEFIEEGGKTKIVSRSVADTPDQIEELIKMGMIEGFKSQLTKLDSLMRKV